MNAVLSRHERCIWAWAQNESTARRIYCGIRHGERGRGCSALGALRARASSLLFVGNSGASRELHHHPLNEVGRNACQADASKGRYRCGCMRARPRQLHGRAHLHGHGQSWALLRRSRCRSMAYRRSTAVAWRAWAEGVRGRVLVAADAMRRKCIPRCSSFPMPEFPPYDRCCGEGGDCVRMGRRPGGEALNEPMI